MNKKEMIRVTDLWKSFGDLTVLRGISTSFYEGETVAILGASGGGKSTFLRCLNRLEEPERGSILFEGTELMDKKDRYCEIPAADRDGFPAF